MYFSVIVPVYDVEPYLKNCVDSVLAQTLRDFELILVDDGSPDESPALCDACAGRDSRVRVIHQPNAGVTAARKAGLRAARGKYVLFVDGDDWVSPQYLQRGKVLIEETGAELVLFSCCRMYGSGRSEALFEPAPEGLYSRESAREAFFPSLVMDAHMRHMSYSCSGKLFRRDLAERGLFSVSPKIALGEDLLSVLPAFLEAGSIFVSRETTSFFRIRAQSASHGFRQEHFRQAELVLEALERVRRERTGLPRDFGIQMERYGAYMCFTFMLHAANDGRRDALGQLRAGMDRPLLRSCLQHAAFQRVTPKTKITLALLRQGRTASAYAFLRLCRRIKLLVKRG